MKIVIENFQTIELVFQWLTPAQTTTTSDGPDILLET